jgi:hypothetical protein
MSAANRGEEPAQCAGFSERHLRYVIALSSKWAFRYAMIEATISFMRRSL